jgi:hypothetical protein
MGGITGRPASGGKVFPGKKAGKSGEWNIFNSECLLKFLNIKKQAYEKKNAVTGVFRVYDNGR